MSLGRIIFLGLFLLFGLPIILILFFQVGTGAIVYSTARSFENSMAPDTDPFAGKYQITNHFSGKDYLKSGYQSLAHIDKMISDRVLSLTLPIKKTHEGMLVDKPLAIALAGGIANGECERLKIEVAKECEVVSINVDEDHRDEKQYNAFITISFIQKAGLGTIAADKPLIFGEEIGALAITSGRPRQSTLSKLGVELQRVYKETALGCEAIKKKVGNCSISYIYVSAYLKRGSTITLDAKVSLAYLAPAQR